MSRLLLAAGIAAAAYFFSPAIGHAQDLEEQRKLCNQALAMPPEAVIGACTAMIRSESATVENRAAAYVNRGLADAKMHDLARAVADESAAIALNPSENAAYKDRGAYRFEMHDYAGSLSDLQRYSNLHFPPEPEVVHEMALDDYRLGRTEDALVAATDAIKARSANSTALLLRAQIFELMKLPQFAYIDEEQTAAIPDYWAKSPGMLFDRAQADGVIGSYARALDDLRAVLKREPQNVGALSYRCFYLAMLGRYDDALHDCSVALVIRPNDESTLQSRGFTYYKMHQYAKALRDLRTAVSLNPSDSDAFYVLGLTERAAGSAAAAGRDVARAQQLGRLAAPAAGPMTFNKPFPRIHYGAHELTFWSVDSASFASTFVEVYSYSGRLYVDEETSWRNQPTIGVWYEVPFSSLRCMMPNRSSGTVTLVAAGNADVVAYFNQTNGTIATRTVALQSWGTADELARVLTQRVPGLHRCAGT